MSKIPPAFTQSYGLYSEYCPYTEQQADLASRVGGSYDIGKRQCEDALAAHSDTVPWTTLRFANIEGPHDPSNRRGFFIDRIRDGGGILLPSDVLSPYQPLWRDDAARAVAQVAGHPLSHGRVFNVAGSEVYTVSEWLNLVAQTMGCPPPGIFALPAEALQRVAGFAYRIPLPMRPLLDTTALKECLGFHPTAARAWLPDTIRWWETAGMTKRVRTLSRRSVWVIDTTEWTAERGALSAPGSESSGVLIPGPQCGGRPLSHWLGFRHRP